jgi:hypothetical protein
MSDPRPSIDPRYDPAFQRGGVDAVRLRPYAPAAAPERSDDGLPVGSAVAAAPDAGPRGGDAGVGGATSERHPAARPVVVASGVRAGGNPWLLALWIVGALLTAAGGWAIWTGENRFVSAAPTTDFVTPMVLVAIAPALLTAGLLGIVAAIVLHAIAWRRDSADADGDDAEDDSGSLSDRYSA